MLLAIQEWVPFLINHGLEQLPRDRTEMRYGNSCAMTNINEISKQLTGFTRSPLPKVAPQHPRDAPRRPARGPHEAPKGPQEAPLTRDPPKPPRSLQRSPSESHRLRLHALHTCILRNERTVRKWNANSGAGDNRGSGRRRKLAWVH